jgi:predicted transposase YdaD
LLIQVETDAIAVQTDLRQYQPSQDWQAVIIFAKRSIEPDFPHQYRGLLPQIHCVYLDELTVNPNQAIGVIGGCGLGGG